MAVPTSPKRLQVIDRCVAVLKAIDPSLGFFYPAYAVQKRLMHFKECGGFPTYFVFMGAGAGAPEQHMDSEYVESLTLSIQGWVDMELGEPQTKLCKCIRDVQLAISTDAKSTVTGSLGILCSNGLVDIGGVETDSGGFILEGFAFFDQTISVKLMGDWGLL
ncbi:MAG: hypothetical protein E4H44_01330 [Candidatus Aminicenantes bacterium]|nr:MAG: hypothetical protein E4H44_01330 [Candidatus Aminicenantes bacterium]